MGDTLLVLVLGIELKPTTLPICKMIIRKKHTSQRVYFKIYMGY